MDFKECIQKEIIKDVLLDANKVTSVRNIAQQKINSANYLPNEHHIAKISLLYDALREYLEALALEEGYKIYNHECYTAFIKEILKKSSKGDLFDKIRKTRNNINYYGVDVNLEEAEEIIKEIKELIKTFSK
jgi:uncharacterized protein (UPF0332 family)